MSSRNRLCTCLDEILVALKTPIQHSVSRFSTEVLYFSFFPGFPSSPCLQSGAVPSVYIGICNHHFACFICSDPVYIIYFLVMYVYCFPVRFHRVAICMKQIWIHFGMKCTPFRIFTPWSSERIRRFRGTCHLNIQGRKMSQENLPPLSAGFLLFIVFDPEDWSDMFFRNIGLSQKYTALQPTRQYSSYLSPWEHQIQI
jgi:hypothetical protein